MAKARRRVSIGACYRAWRNLKKWQRKELKQLLAGIHEQDCAHEASLPVIEISGSEVRCLYKKYQLLYLCDPNGLLRLISIEYCVKARRSLYAA